MSDPPIGSSSLVWLWVVEYLASFREINSSVLHKLIEQAPAFPTDFAKSARERVALRCLEDLLASANAVDHGEPSASEPKVVIDLSDSCEDVIEAILREVSMADLKEGGPELLKWDLQPFIMHKRAAMPKPALEQLKETIVEGSEPMTAWVAKLSGVVRRSEDGNGTIVEERGRVEAPGGIDNQTETSGGLSMPQPPVDGEGVVGEELHESNMLSTEGDEVGTNRCSASLGEQECLGAGGDQLEDAGRCEQDMLCSKTACDNNLVEDPFKGKVQVTEKADCHMEPESPRGVTVEGHERSSHVDNVSGETSDQCIQAHSDDMLEGNLHGTDYNTDEMPHGMSDVLPETVVDDQAHESDPGVPSDMTLKACHQNVSPDGRNNDDGCDTEPKSGDVLLATGSPRNNNAMEEDGHMRHPRKEDTQRDAGGYGHERVSDDAKKSNFPSSRGLLSEEFLAAADLSGSNLCVKCSKNGQLLFCGADGCPLAIHESCLGFPPSFDNRGKFCCPFCAYSLASSHYTKTKERTSAMLKQLSAFLHEGSENPSRDPSVRSFDVEIRNVVARGGNQANNGKDVNEGNDNQVPKGADRVQLGAAPANCLSNQPTSEHQPGDVLCVSRASGESRIKGTTQACPSVPVPERNQDLDLPEPRRFGDNQSRENKDEVLEQQQQARGATEKEVSQEIHVHRFVMPIRAIPLTQIAADDDSKNDEAIGPNHSSNSRKRKRPSRKDMVPSPRRAAVKWTVAEEKKLKEGVNKYAHNVKLPWRSILEYGRSVFGDTRTPEDLRCKWKKMCNP